MRKIFIAFILAAILLALFYLSNRNTSMSDAGIGEEQVIKLSEDSLPASEANLLVEADGVITVRAYCTGCHSEKLVAQNRATREGWKSMIVWMQQTQNLGDLGENESRILDYLATNYAPDTLSRRRPLTIEWYYLEE